MLKTLLNAFFLWRRNNARSIAFKTLAFGGIGWLIASPFTRSLNALYAAGAAAVFGLTKYVLQYRREQAQMLEMVGGDRQKLKALKIKLLNKGLGGALMMEMLRAEMSPGDCDDDEPEMTDEQREQNRAASKANLERILTAVAAHPELVIENQQERVASLTEELADGEYEHSIDSMLVTLFEEHGLSFGYEDYCNDDDHAGLVEMFAQATAGAWTVSDCTSKIDYENEKCIVRFMDNGEEQVWRFNQGSDWISNTFLCKLTKYVEERSGRKLITVDSEDYFEGLVLPHDFYEGLTNSELQKAA